MCVLIVFEKLFVCVFATCPEVTFVQRFGFCLALWALPVLDDLKSSSESELLWNLQATQIQVQIHMWADLGLSCLRDGFLSPSPLPTFFPFSPVGVVEAS